MSGGLFGLLDDIAALAKLAASSIDDVGVAAGKVSVKTAGVVVDDTAVTPAYVQGLAPERELPIIRRIAKGSLRNKLAVILPVALLLSVLLPLAVEVALLVGGTYLAYEAVHKIRHRRAHDVESAPALLVGPAAEDVVVRNAVRTDFVLSAEIMIIALKEVLDEGFVLRAAVLALVAVFITVVVYGAVAIIVKMDDAGLRLASGPGVRRQKVGRSMVTLVPRLLSALTIIGTAAMAWVGGHILLAGSDALGWHWPYDQVHHLEAAFDGLPVVSGLFSWLASTAAAALVGIIVGAAALVVLRACVPIQAVLTHP